MNFLYKKRIHFIGIGGVGVNALASFALDCGAVVSGSDRSVNQISAQLASRGVSISSDVQSEAVDMADIVVFSSAIHHDNPQLVRARALNKRVLERHEFLGEVSSKFGRVVAIAGTHGKTTVTAMLTHVLKENGVPFVSMIGGEAYGFGHYVNTLPRCSDNYSDEEFARALFVTEACEYHQSLLSLNPDIGVITNIECDHPDCYKTPQSLIQVFEQFVAQSKRLITSYGLSVTLSEGGDLLKIEDMHTTQNDNTEDFFVSCGECIYGYNMDKAGNIIFFNTQGDVCNMCAPIHGAYNRENALFAFACACECGVPCKSAAKSLGCFKGVARRMEYAGKICGKPVYFDFAHHPTEIRRVLAHANEKGRVLVVFQPHTYSRTKAYIDDYVSSLSDGAQELIIMPTYAAREDSSCGFDSAALVSKIIHNAPETHVYLVDSITSTISLAKKLTALCDVCMFIGAGDIYALKGLLHD